MGAMNESEQSTPGMTRILENYVAAIPQTFIDSPNKKVSKRSMQFYFSASAHIIIFVFGNNRFTKVIFFKF